jgi:hypothetical protein
MERWLWKITDVGGGHGLFKGTVSAQNTAVRISGNPLEIRTEYLQNTSLEC